MQIKCGVCGIDRESPVDGLAAVADGDERQDAVEQGVEAGDRQKSNEAFPGQSEDEVHPEGREDGDGEPEISVEILLNIKLRAVAAGAVFKGPAAAQGGGGLGRG